MPSSSATPQGTTLIEVLDELRTIGYSGQLIAQDDGTLRCIACGETTPVDAFVVDGYQRLEGASDAADMNLVAWAECPNCGQGGALTLGYGPNASEADTSVLPGLTLDDAEQPGATPAATTRSATSTTER